MQSLACLHWREILNFLSKQCSREIEVKRTKLSKSHRNHTGRLCEQVSGDKGRKFSARNDCRALNQLSPIYSMAAIFDKFHGVASHQQRCLLVQQPSCEKQKAMHSLIR